MGDVPQTLQAGLSTSKENLNHQWREIRAVRNLLGRSQNRAPVPQHQGTELAERGVIMLEARIGTAKRVP